MMNINYKKLLFLLLTSVGCLNAFDKIDLSQLHLSRIKQYDIGHYDNITLYSPHRTGSTVVYNVLRYLFEDDDIMDILGYYFRKKKNLLANKVCKTHFFWPCEQDNTCIVSTIRHPLDTIVSRMRISPKDRSDQAINKLIRDYFTSWTNIRRLQSYGKKVIVLQYEDFEDNLDAIFSRLEEQLSINIEEQDKANLKNALSRENVQDYIQKFSSFSKKDITHLHGNHIESDNSPYFNKEEARQRVAKLLIPYKKRVQEVGYSLESELDRDK